MTRVVATRLACFVLLTLGIVGFVEALRVRQTRSRDSGEDVLGMSAVFGNRSGNWARARAVSTPSYRDLWRANQEMLAAHNAQRALRNLPPLRLDANLFQAALNRARRCAARDSTTAGKAASLGDAREQYGLLSSQLAENVAVLPASRHRRAESCDGDRVVAGWMSEEPLRSNVLGPYTHLGAAFADRARGRRFWVVLYATGDSTIPTDSTSRRVPAAGAPDQCAQNTGTDARESTVRVVDPRKNSRSGL